MDGKKDKTPCLSNGDSSKKEIPLMVGDTYNWVKSQKSKPQVWRPHSCLVGLYKAFCEKIAFQHENKPRDPSAQDLKIQWEMIYRPKRSKKANLDK